MPKIIKSRSLGWRHELWNIVRYYRSIGKNKKTISKFWLSGLIEEHKFQVVSKKPKEDPEVHGVIDLPEEIVLLFQEYLKDVNEQMENSFSNLRLEKDALKFCRDKGISVSTTKTKSKDHHQASKAVIALVDHIVDTVCNQLKIDYVADPTTRCVWLEDEFLHITARNLDGAIPGLINPLVIWEIKEYWGKTSGGSKMSDALYECQLVGRELREFEEKSGKKVIHIVFLDGKEQWESRVSDFIRFLDIFNQGLIDYLYIGKEIELFFEKDLLHILKENIQ